MIEIVIWLLAVNAVMLWSAQILRRRREDQTRMARALRLYCQITSRYQRNGGVCGR